MKNSLKCLVTATLLLGMQWIASAAMAGPVSERVLARRSVRVCIWPEYYGVTYRHPQTRQLSGIDIELSRELGKDLDATIEYVESSFPSLIQDLRSDRCDVCLLYTSPSPRD